MLVNSLTARARVHKSDDDIVAKIEVVLAPYFCLVLKQRARVHKPDDDIVVKIEVLFVPYFCSVMVHFDGHDFVRSHAPSVPDWLQLGSELPVLDFVLEIVIGLLAFVVVQLDEICSTLWVAKMGRQMGYL